MHGLVDRGVNFQSYHVGYQENLPHIFVQRLLLGIFLVIHLVILNIFLLNKIIRETRTAIRFFSDCRIAA